MCELTDLRDTLADALGIAPAHIRPLQLPAQRGILVPAAPAIVAEALETLRTGGKLPAPTTLLARFVLGTTRTEVYLAAPATCDTWS